MTQLAQAAGTSTPPGSHGRGHVLPCTLSMACYHDQFTHHSLSLDDALLDNRDESLTLSA